MWLSKLKNNRGSATVEAAITLPLLTLIVFGFLFLNGAIKDSIVIQQAAREGAREYAMTNNGTSGINVASQELLDRGINPSKATITAVAAGDARGIRIAMNVAGFTDQITISSEMYFHRWR